MTAFDTYKLFTALNNHFYSGGYDFFRYGTSVKIKPETFQKKNPADRIRYERLGKKFGSQDELENFIVANMIHSDKRLWIGDLFGGEASDIYTRWLGKTQSLQYSFISEIKAVMDKAQTFDPAATFNSLFICDPGQHPEILKALMRRDLSLESFIVLDLCVKFIDRIDKRIGDDSTWRNIKLKATKYRPFLQRLNIEVAALRKSLLEALEDLGVTS